MLHNPVSQRENNCEFDLIVIFFFFFLQVVLKLEESNLPEDAQLTQYHIK